MVEWGKRFLTGAIAVPVIFVVMQSKLLIFLFVNVILFISTSEYNKIVSQILQLNSAQMEHGYIKGMQSVLSHIPSHLFIVLVTLLPSDGAIHCALFISIVFFCLHRIFHFLSHGTFLAQKKDEKDTYIDRRFYILTFIQIAFDIFGFIVFCYPLSFMIVLSNQPDGIGYVLLWLISTWQTDNGALFFGAAFGNRPFLKLISPKKTWEGVTGALFFSMLTALFLFMYMKQGTWHPILLPSIPLKHYLLISALVAIIAISGDAIESFIKRAANVKDSGTLFPGHGGVLDRLDSLAFSSPVVYFYVKAVLGV
eukprot:TRINITY_DN10966_c0_g2_i2.p1 TRINITY_DN10966_c0_g2~~TRINITY_DN10966_c0_g2_i2.p1  ORF type:complete len:310 (+),score=52.77 TRINITY_DN10966_c0_g2_i2:157-1086(+)